MGMWRVIVALALVLPAAAFVVGSLTADSEEPVPRPTIVVTPGDSPPSQGSPTTSGRPESPRGSPTGPSPDIDVIMPRPDDVNDDDEDGGRGRGGSDDDDSDDSEDRGGSGDSTDD